MNKLCDFKYYDKIIDYSYYTMDQECKDIIKEYQNFALDKEEIDSSKNTLIDDIMYSFINNNDFNNYIKEEFKQNFSFQTFSDYLIELYNIYIKEKFKITKEY